MSLRSSPPAHARVSSNPSFVVSVYSLYSVYAVHSMYSVVKPLASALCAPRSDWGRGPIMASDLPPHATLVWSPRHNDTPPRTAVHRDTRSAARKEMRQCHLMWTLEARLARQSRCRARLACRGFAAMHGCGQW